MKIFCENRRANFDYEILEKYVAGIELFGFEVKSIKLGRANISQGYVIIKNNEVYLINSIIPPYQVKNTPENYNDSRPRRLLLKKDEIKTLSGATYQKGLSLIPLKFFSQRSKIKLEFALTRGRKKYDKREAIKKREAKREIKLAF